MIRLESTLPSSLPRFLTGLSPLLDADSLDSTQSMYSMLYSVHFTLRVHCTQSTIYTVHIEYSVHCTYRVLSTLYTLSTQYTVHTDQTSWYTVHRGSVHSNGTSYLLGGR